MLNRARVYVKTKRGEKLRAVAVFSPDAPNNNRRLKVLPV